MTVLFVSLRGTECRGNLGGALCEVYLLPVYPVCTQNTFTRRLSGYLPSCQREDFSLNIPGVSLEVLGKEAIHIFLAKPAVTPRTYTVSLKYPLITPPPHRINVYVEKAG